MVTIEVIAVGGVKLTAAWVADVPGPDLSDAIALVPGTTQNIAANCLLSYTAPAYGVLVLTPAVGLGEATDIIDVAYSINGGAQDYLMSNAENSIELNEGDVLLLDVTVQVSWEPHTISSEWFEGGLPVDLVLGDNAIAGEDIYFTYTATGSGALELGLVLGSTSSLRDQLSLSYSINGGESVVLVSGRPSAVTEVINLTKGDELLITVKTNITATLTAAWSVLPTPLQTSGWHTIKKETVSFTYTAETNGTLTLIMKIMGIPFNVYANGSYTINGGETVILPKDQDVAIAMNQGDQILITVETNANNTRLTATWAGEKPACQHTNTKVEGAVDATCTKGGYTGDTVCADCGEMIAEGAETAPLDHAYANGTCTACGAADPNYVGPTCQHTHTKVEGAVEATCEDKGYTGDTVCADCGETVTKGTEIAALGHNYVDGVCTNCNNPKTFDVFGIMVAVMAASGTALVVLKKKED